MSENLTPEQVDGLKLPRFNIWAKRRKIGALAAQMAEGVPELAGRKPRTQTGLYILAQRRTLHDTVESMLEDQTGTLRWAEEKLLELGIQVEEDPEQLVIDISGEE
jgi:hypothetical protein